MKKSERIEGEIGGPFSGPLEQHPCYLGWFEHFNSGRYYEAHDVLEHLWLRTTDENYAFFKGLIQLAGAFVHLKKHRENPGHPKHSSRLRPAARLFALARRNLAPFPPGHLCLHVNSVAEVCDRWAAELAAGGFQFNPWAAENRPHIPAPK